MTALHYHYFIQVNRRFLRYIIKSEQIRETVDIDYLIALRNVVLIINIVDSTGTQLM